MSFRIFEIESPAEKSAACDRIIHKLPNWFGLPDSNAHYIKDISDKDTLAVESDGQICGLLALCYHFDRVAEIWWMGVAPDFHGRGIGAALVNVAKARSREKSCRKMAVQTLSPRRKDTLYARTRTFYEKSGFESFVEFNENDVNPMMWMVMELN